MFAFFFLLLYSKKIYRFKIICVQNLRETMIDFSTHTEGFFLYAAVARMSRNELNDHFSNLRVARFKDFLPNSVFQFVWYMDEYFFTLEDQYYHKLDNKYLYLAVVKTNNMISIYEIILSYTYAVIKKV